MNLEVSTRLKDVFGFDALREGQSEIVEALLAGRSALAIFPTGGGKSLCYQLPALMWPGLTVVVSPLMALMRDQVDFLTGKGIAAARLDSSLDGEQVTEVFRLLKANQLKLLYVAPERFANERFRESLAQCSIELLAVDEAHCISEWGHNFRPDYLKLADIMGQLAIKRCLALTATATPSVAIDVQRAFGIEERDVVQTGFRRENLALNVTPCSIENRNSLLVEKMMAIEGAIIVYVTLQQTAEEVSGVLQKAGISARAYHAGMRSEAREEVQTAFMEDQLRVVVATIAFGMGIDKGNIRAVFHYNLPKTLENYVQEIGRAGRDGLRSHCEVLACLDDLVTLENFVFGDTPDASALKSVTEHILLIGEDFDLSIYHLSRSCDVKPVVLETVLAYLELQGWIRSGGAFYAERAIQFVRGEEQALAGHNPERQRFLRKLFATGKMGRSWLSLSLENSSEELGESIEKIAKAIDWLEAHGDIRVKPSKVRRRFTRLKEANTAIARELADKLTRVFHQREDRDIERLDGVVAFLKEERCLVVALLEYFGEEGAHACAMCSVCVPRAEGQAVIPERELPELSLEDFELIQGVLAEGQVALQKPRQIARFFCGISGPALMGAGLKKHRAFGVFSDYSFQDVLAAIQALGRRPL